MLNQVITTLPSTRDAMPHGGTLTLATEFVEIDQEAAATNPDARPDPPRVSPCPTRERGSNAKSFRTFSSRSSRPRKSARALGLAAVHGIVQQHKGWIVVSSAEGKGTRFEIFLPCSAAPATKKCLPARALEPMHAS